MAQSINPKFDIPVKQSLPDYCDKLNLNRKTH